ncbi:hypothetical protein V1477_020797 [Vespula maculifrons]|uniref:Uncharacterized protein n=1 Tax=Vespula maculifrons TaxID=7453 RepID=A0ABD2AMY6_VESMC
MIVLEVARAHVPPSGKSYSPVKNLQHWSLQKFSRRSRFKWHEHTCHLQVSHILLLRIYNTGVCKNFPEDPDLVLEVARAHVPPSGKSYSPVKNLQHWSLQKFSRRSRFVIG